MKRNASKSSNEYRRCEPFPCAGRYTWFDDVAFVQIIYLFLRKFINLFDVSRSIDLHILKSLQVFRNTHLFSIIQDTSHKSNIFQAISFSFQMGCPTAFSRVRISEMDGKITLVVLRMEVNRDIERLLPVTGG